MALGLLALQIYLWRNPHRIRLVWQVSLGMIALYKIFSRNRVVLEEQLEDIIIPAHTTAPEML